MLCLPLQKQPIVTLALQKLAFKYLKHFIRTKSSIFRNDGCSELRFLRKDEVWLYCCLAFRKIVSDIMRVTKESLPLRANVWTLDLIISSGHMFSVPVALKAVLDATWLSRCAVLWCISQTIYKEITTNFPLRFCDLKREVAMPLVCKSVPSYRTERSWILSCFKMTYT